MAKKNINKALEVVKRILAWIAIIWEIYNIYYSVPVLVSEFQPFTMYYLQYNIGCMLSLILLKTINIVVIIALYQWQKPNKNN